MNAGPDVERLIAGWLTEEAPWRAPDRILEGAGMVIDRTRQRRFIAAWREPMYVTMRGLLAAGVAVVLIGGAVLLLGRPAGTGSTTTTPTPTPSPSVTAAPTAIAAPIPPGTYAADIPVEGILTQLDANSTLNETTKTAVVNEILAIKDATTLNLQLVISVDSFVLLQGTDGGAKYTNPAWRLAAFDADTVVIRRSAQSPVIGYDVTWDGDSFTMRTSSSGPTPVEEFVLHILFESEPFRLAP